MVEEGRTRWHFRVWAEWIPLMILIPFPGVLALVNTITLGALNYVLPFRKRDGKDLPAWVSARSSEVFSISLPDIFKLLLYFIYVILDAVSTPGGLSISEEGLDNWKAKLEEGEGVWSTTDFTIYMWDWINRTIFTNPDLCDNVDGIYKVNDLFMDLFSIALTAVIALILFKNAGKIAGGVGKVFGKQVTRRRNKKMKELASQNLENTSDIQTDAKKLEVQLQEVLMLLKKDDLRMVEEVDPDLQKIIKQTKKLRI